MCPKRNEGTPGGFKSAGNSRSAEKADLFVNGTSCCATNRARVTSAALAGLAEAK